MDRETDNRSAFQSAIQLRAGDLDGPVEWAELNEDREANLPEPVEGEQYLTQGTMGRGEVFYNMIQRAAPWDVTREAYALRSQRYGGGFRTRENVSNILGERMGLFNPEWMPERDPDFEPDFDMLENVREHWQLPERAIYFLERNARNEQDLEVLAEAYASTVQRDQLISASVGPVDGFLMDLAANALRPEFLVAGAGFGKAFQIGRAVTRAGAASRGAAAGAATDLPMELFRSGEDPSYTMAHALATASASALLGGVIGGAAGVLRPNEIMETGAALDNAIRRVQDGNGQVSRRTRLMQDGSGDLSGGQHSHVYREPRPFDESEEAVERLRFSFGTPINRLYRSEDPDVRNLASQMTWNPFADVSDRVQPSTMWETSTRIYESGGMYQREFQMAAQEYYQGTQADTTAGRVSNATGTLTDDQFRNFGEIVADELEGLIETGNPAVQRAVAAIREGFEDTLRYAQDDAYLGPGSVPRGERVGRSIPEFEEIEFNPNYLPRQVDTQGLRSVLNNHGAGRNADAAVASLGRRLSQVFMRSEDNVKTLEFLTERWNANKVSDPMTVERMAERVMSRYVETLERVTDDVLQEARVGQPMVRGITPEDRAVVREIAAEEIRKRDPELGEAIEDVSELILDLIAPVSRRNEADSPRAKPRATLPLNRETDGDILPIWNRDALRLFTAYRRHMAGRAAIFRNGGFETAQQLQNQIERIARNARGKDGRMRSRAQREVQLLQNGMHNVLGQMDPRYTPGEQFSWWGAQIARNNVAAFMSNVGFTMFSEVGGLAQLAGMRRMAKAIPEYRRYINAVRRGDKEAMEELAYVADAFFGTGTSQVRARLSGSMSRFDADYEELYDPGTGWQRSVDETNRKITNVVMRPAGAMTEVMRTTGVTSEIAESVAAARSGGSWHNPQYMRQLGVTEEMWERIATQLRKVEDFESPHSGRQVPNIDFARFDDPEAMNVWLNAINRNVKRLIQEQDWGMIDPNLRQRTLGRLMGQFLTFPLTAWSKQVGFAARGIQGGNMRPLLEAAMMSLGGGIGVLTRTGIKTASIQDEQERQEYFEKHVNGRELWLGFIYYSAHASIFPNLIDMGLGVASQFTDNEHVQPIFSRTRNSTLPSDPIAGNPTYQRAYRLLWATGDLFEGGGVSEEDFQSFVGATLPAGNSVLLRPGIEWVSQLFPEEEEMGDDQ